METTTNNATNATNNEWKQLDKSIEQLENAAQRYNERAENGQTIAFNAAYQRKASSNAKNAKDGYLPGVFWSGVVTLQSGEKIEFEKLDSNGISRKFADVCTWIRNERQNSLLTGNATRTPEQRKIDAQKAINEAREKPTADSVTGILWQLAESSTIMDNETETPLLNFLTIRITERIAAADGAAAEKAKSKESKTAKAEREANEAKAEAAAALAGMQKAADELVKSGMPIERVRELFPLLNW